MLTVPGLGSGLAAMLLLMATYGGFLFALALQLQGGLGDSALRAGLTFGPSAVAFGLCGFFWNRLPLRLHHWLTPVACTVAAAMYILLGLDLASGTHGGAAFQVILVVLGGSLALGFSPLVAHSLLHVPVTEAADASGLLTTTLQLGQAIGVATFGSLFLTLAARRGPALEVSGHGDFGRRWYLAAGGTAIGLFTAIRLNCTVLAGTARQPAAQG